MKRLFLAAMVPLAFGCDGRVSVGGRVTDGAGQPIEGAVVSVGEVGREATLTAVSSETGHYQLDRAVGPGRYELEVVVTAPGRKEFRGTIQTLTKNECDVRLVAKMQPEPSAGGPDCHAVGPCWQIFQVP